MAVSANLKAANSTRVTGERSEVHFKENDSRFSMHSAEFLLISTLSLLTSKCPFRIAQKARQALCPDSLTLLHARHLFEICGMLARRSSIGGRERQVSGLKPPFWNDLQSQVETGELGLILPMRHILK